MNKHSRTLTPKQEKVLSFIEQYRREQGMSPSYQDIQAHFGFASPHAATKHVRALIAKGYVAVRWGGRRNAVRSIRSRRPDAGEVPLVGRIAAGEPVEALELEEARYDLSSLGIDNAGRDYFALTVRGESMIDAHVLDGDMVVVKRQREVAPHDIAAVYWNGEATLKYVKRSGDSIRLIPANDTMEPISVRPEHTESFRILGKVVRVIRRV